MFSVGLKQQLNMLNGADVSIYRPILKLWVEGGGYNNVDRRGGGDILNRRGRGFT